MSIHNDFKQFFDEEILPITGKEMYSKLSKRFGGTTIYFPKDKECSEIRNCKILKLHHDGVSVREISHIVGVTTMTVYRVIRGK